MMTTLLKGFAFFAFAAFIFAVQPAHAADEIYTGLFSNKAVSGYDTVAYFTEGKPVKGTDEHTTKWKGATWHFSSAENLKLFTDNPEKYAPQYGGYCAFALAKNDTVSSDPEAWDITDGKLYLNYSKSVQERWLEDKANYINEANANWPNVLNK